MSERRVRYEVIQRSTAFARTVYPHARGESALPFRVGRDHHLWRTGSVAIIEGRDFQQGLFLFSDGNDGNS